jgi:hypothetical protein
MTDEQHIKELEAELRRIQRKNIRLKMHMEVLVSTPYSKTAERIRYTSGKVFDDSIINLY